MYNKPYQNILQESEKINQTGIFYNILLKKYINLIKCNILDIGCGNGFFCFALSTYCKTIYGIDSSDNMILDAKKNNIILKNKNILFSIKDMSKINFNNKFDILLYSHSLHLSKPLEVLEKNIKLLNDNGIIVIIESTNHFISDRLNPKSNKFNELEYKNKIMLINKCKNDISLFEKKHILLYSLEDNKKYIKIIKII